MSRGVTLRKGMMLSLAMAWSSRGAPVRDCSPAPTVEKNEPMTMTHGDGHDSVPTTRFFLTASPNLPAETERTDFQRGIEPQLHVHLG